MDFNLDPAVLAILIGTVLPILVGLVTKMSASSSIKAVCLAFLSAASGLLTTAQGEGGLVSQESVIYAAVTWVTAVATYYGLLKPTHVSGTVQEKTRNVGIG